MMRFEIAGGVGGGHDFGVRRDLLILQPLPGPYRTAAIIRPERSGSRVELARSRSDAEGALDARSAGRTIVAAGCQGGHSAPAISVREEPNRTIALGERFALTTRLVRFGPDLS